jgi:hypothetical protein
MGVGREDRLGDCRHPRDLASDGREAPAVGTPEARRHEQAHLIGEAIRKKIIR